MAAALYYHIIVGIADVANPLKIAATGCCGSCFCCIAVTLVEDGGGAKYHMIVGVTAVADMLHCCNARRRWRRRHNTIELLVLLLLLICCNSCYWLLW